MDFRETREQLDKLLEEAVIMKNGPTPEKMGEMIEDMRPMLTKLIEMSDPENDIHTRVCGNREIHIASLEAALAKSKVKAIRAAAKRKKKPAVVETTN